MSSQITRYEPHRRQSTSSTSSMLSNANSILSAARNLAVIYKEARRNSINSEASTAKRQPTEANRARANRPRGTGSAESKLQSVGTKQHKAMARKIGKRRIRNKGRKTLKISRVFKAKVLQATEPSKIHGTYHHVQSGIMNPTNHKQGQQFPCYFSPAGDLGDTPLGVAGTGFGNLFSAARVLHVASRLWNGKTAVAQPHVGGGGVNALNLNELTTVVNVRNQFWKFRVRNNSPRTIFLSIFKCMPKSQMDNPLPLDAWQEAITAGINQNYIIGTPVGVSPDPPGPNVTMNHLYTKPTMFKEFNQYYKAEELFCVLEPGQNWDFTIQGPKMVYDMKKFNENANYQLIQKQDIFLLSRYWTDMIGETSTSNSARVPIDNLTSEITWEAEYYCSCSMPETVGWQSTGAAPAAGAVQNINRVRRYVFDDFNFKIATIGTGDRTEFQNPF